MVESEEFYISAANNLLISLKVQKPTKICITCPNPVRRIEQFCIVYDINNLLFRASM